MLEKFSLPTKDGSCDVIYSSTINIDYLDKNSKKKSF